MMPFDGFAFGTIGDVSAMALYHLSHVRQC